MNQYTPPFQITNEIVNQVALISERIGRWLAQAELKNSPQLRRQNRIRTIQASLEIENNTLTVEQVSAVLEGKPVIGPPREIQEVKNALAAYERMPEWNPGELNHFLEAHAYMMSALIDDPGKIRGSGVGIYHGEKLIHMAPPAKQVAGLLQNLFNWWATTDTHPLIAGSVVHYEIEFIHPFTDGNGRMGRLWQTLILSQWQPMLAYLPVETVIRDRQGEYYQALGESDNAAEATPFISFMLDALQSAM